MKALGLVKKGARDLVLTLYDDTEFEAMSLPRVIFFLSAICVIVAWVSAQFFHYTFTDFTILVGWASGNGATYVGKKFVEGRRPAATPPQKDNGMA